MTSQTHRPSTQIDPVPDDLESARAKLVYLTLTASGGATAEELGDLLAMKQINILSVLNSLSSAGHIERSGSEYVVAN